MFNTSVLAHFLGGQFAPTKRGQFTPTKRGQFQRFFQVVKKILEKYNYSLPEVPPNNEFNRLLKIVGSRLKSLNVPFIKQITYKRELKQISLMKYEFLQTHTARRSFCSNEYLRKTNPTLIMAISGHKKYESFMRYIKVTSNQYADQMEEVWIKREQNS